MAPAVLLALAVTVALIGPLARLLGLHLSPVLEAIVFGVAVVGAAAMLAWATEVAQLEVSRALAFTVLALIAVLPEYAVDMYFAWTAATHPEYSAYAAANMTGANRLLVGVGWPLVVFLAVLTARRIVPARPEDVAEVRAELPVRLPGDARLELGVFFAATAYSFLLPFKGDISLWDMLILTSLFGFYAWRAAQAAQEEPEMIGPAALIAALPRGRRRVVTVAMFIVAAASIFTAAEPFAESLIATGTVLGIDRFLLVQWLAPFASEAPELIVVCLLAVRGQAGLALAALVSSKVNQWTLLVGMLPLAYSLGGRTPQALPLDAHQAEEVLLTSAQSLLAFAMLMDLRLTGRDALLLFLLFALQFVFPGLRIAVTIVYLVLAAILLIANRERLRAYLPLGRFSRPVAARPPRSD